MSVLLFLLGAWTLLLLLLLGPSHQVVHAFRSGFPALSSSSSSSSCGVRGASSVWTARAAVQHRRRTRAVTVGGGHVMALTADYDDEIISVRRELLPTSSIAISALDRRRSINIPSTIPTATTTTATRLSARRRRSGAGEEEEVGPSPNESTAAEEIANADASSVTTTTTTPASRSRSSKKRTAGTKEEDTQAPLPNDDATGSSNDNGAAAAADSGERQRQFFVSIDFIDATNTWQTLLVRSDRREEVMAQLAQLPGLRVLPGSVEGDSSDIISDIAGGDEVKVDLLREQEEEGGGAVKDDKAPTSASGSKRRKKLKKASEHEDITDGSNDGTSALESMVAMWGEEGVAYLLSDPGMDALTAALEARPVRDSLSLGSYLGQDHANSEMTVSVGSLVQGSHGIPVYWNNESAHLLDDLRLLSQQPSTAAGVNANATNWRRSVVNNESLSASQKSTIGTNGSLVREGRSAPPVGSEVQPPSTRTLRYYASHTAPPPRWASQVAPTYIRALYKRVPVYLRSEVVDQFGHLAVPMDKLNMSMIDAAPSVEYLVIAAPTAEPLSSSPSRGSSRGDDIDAGSSMAKKTKMKSNSNAPSKERKAQGGDLSKYHVICLPKADMDQLKKDGMIFKNVSTLLANERLERHRDEIYNRLRADGNVTSEAWRNYIDVYLNKNRDMNHATLSHVVAAYFQNFTVGDIGPNFEAAPGYVGTLAPGCAPGMPLDDESRAKNLPKKLMMPWPDFQEIPWHVRWPVPHPPQPHPFVWMAKNNLFLDSYVKNELADPYKAQETIGGPYMRPVDGMRIATHYVGASYDPAEQIEHGGFKQIPISDEEVPHYKADHGPTVSEEEAHVDFPPELRHIMEPWYDSTHGEGLPDYFPRAQITTPDAVSAASMGKSSLNRISANGIINKDNAHMLYSDEIDLPGTAGTTWLRQRAKLLDLSPDERREKELEVSARNEASSELSRTAYAEVFRKQADGDAAAEAEAAAIASDEKELDAIRARTRALRVHKTRERRQLMEDIYSQIQATPRSLKRFLLMKRVRGLMQDDAPRPAPLTDAERERLFADDQELAAIMRRKKEREAREEEAVYQEHLAGRALSPQDVYKYVIQRTRDIDEYTRQKPLDFYHELKLRLAARFTRRRVTEVSDDIRDID